MLNALMVLIAAATNEGALQQDLESLAVVPPRNPRTKQVGSYLCMYRLCMYRQSDRQLAYTLKHLSVNIQFPSWYPYFVVARVEG